MEEPILIQYGGCKLFRVKNKIVLLSIGNAEINSNSTQAYINARKKAKIRSLVTVLKATGVQIKTLSVIDDDRNSGNNSANTEDFLNIIKEEVRGHTRVLPIVGEWYSHDEKNIYIALGLEINKKDFPK